MKKIIVSLAALFVIITALTLSILLAHPDEKVIHEVQQVATPSATLTPKNSSGQTATSSSILQAIPTQAPAPQPVQNNQSTTVVNQPQPEQPKPTQAPASQPTATPKPGIIPTVIQLPGIIKGIL